MSIYVFFITALIVFGVVERILITGFKPGRYATDSTVFLRWLIYSGLHLILMNTVLPFMTGTPWAKLFYKILGCKIGKNVFINSKWLNDSYLLEVEDNVVIGGDAIISCHTFEGQKLVLGKIKIGSDTLISANTYIMPGAAIGKKCNIGLFSYVRKNKVIPGNTMIMAIPGVPAKKVAEIIRE
jgi:carbonic anhydrase/acetyltransferase-like protein (isoleucine patch superfamily)